MKDELKNSPDWDTRQCQPCGGGSPYQDYLDKRGLKEQDIVIDIIRDWIPSARHREKLLAKIREILPSLTSNQKQILGLISQGNSFDEVARMLSVSKGTIQEAIEAVRKKIADC